MSGLSLRAVGIPLGVALVTLHLAGCDTPQGPPPAIAVTLSSAGQLSLVTLPDVETDVAVTVIRLNGFEGSVTVTIDGLPAGVTSAPLIIPANETSGNVPLAVSAAAAPGSTTLTVRATASGVEPATATFSLVVVAAPAAFTSTLDPAIYALPLAVGPRRALNVVGGKEASLRGR